METEQGGITINACAELLGISDRSLRRLLAERPEWKSKSVVLERVGKTGARPARCLPPGLVAEISAVLESERAERGNTGKYSTEPRGNTADAQLPAVSYQRILAEVEARLADALASLEHERALTLRLSDALSREQSLRALTAPESPSEPAEKESLWQRLFARRKP